MKVPVEDAYNTHKGASDCGEDTQAPDSEVVEMTEEEMVEAAIRAGEQAAEDDIKLKLEQVQAEIVDVRRELEEAEAARLAADERAQEAQERTSRLQADWENYRRRTAKERIEERERATEKLICAIFPVLDDMERALEHARTQEMSESLSQFVEGVDAVRAKLMAVLSQEGVAAIDPAGAAFDPMIHQAVGRVEDSEQFVDTVHDVYQKGYTLAGKVLRPAMVTVTYGGATRPAPEPEEATEEPACELDGEETSAQGDVASE
ncbi:nucleotide exchange factor GrpE [Collinsella sp. zg1085]|uniref:nucleotide exchange factor GrpE n=1 Tax=Collinsella sp. zg1085 TaxID=2844380 RepID=UPI001C0C5AA6|nr:nucleotide exchange factor GrpE [Collinsella sp. zg1085]QWT17799.1 nucleotide exchange factor GrpE [Collinsella sp. zg1085]